MNPYVSAFSHIVQQVQFPGGGAPTTSQNAQAPQNPGQGSLPPNHATHVPGSLNYGPSNHLMMQHGIPSNAHYGGVGGYPVYHQQQQQYSTVHSGSNTSHSYSSYATILPPPPPPTTYPPIYSAYTTTPLMQYPPLASTTQYTHHMQQTYHQQQQPHHQHQNNRKQINNAKRGSKQGAPAQQASYAHYGPQTGSITNAANVTSAGSTAPSSSAITATATTMQVSSSSIPSQAPSSVTFHCDACDKSFPQKTMFEAHCATHELCQHPGCTFTASKRVVQAHYHSKHGQYSDVSGYKDIEVEGQSFRVLMGTSPEEVAQWRESRRRAFPSQQRVVEKQQQQQELQTAGGIDTQPKDSKKHRQEALKRKREQQYADRRQRQEQQKLQRQAKNQQRNKDNTETATTHGGESRNYIQIRSGRKDKEDGEVDHAEDENEDVPVIKLSLDQDPEEKEGDGDAPAAKRVRFDANESRTNSTNSKANNRNNSNNRNKRNNTNTNNGTNKKQTKSGGLRKPDISGNLLLRLMDDEIRGSENLLLQSIRFLRSLYAEPAAAALLSEPETSGNDGSDPRLAPASAETTLQKSDVVAEYLAALAEVEDGEDEDEEEDDDEAEDDVDQDIDDEAEDADDDDVKEEDSVDSEELEDGEMRETILSATDAELPRDAETVHHQIVNDTNVQDTVADGPSLVNGLALLADYDSDC